MFPLRAALFDLDNTLMDRNGALLRYIALFAEYFAPQIDGVTRAQVETIFVEADGGGYTPKPVALEKVRQSLRWKRRPSLDEIQAHYHEAYPNCALEMPGAKITLGKLRTRGLKTGIITNGTARTQNIKIDLLGFRPLIDIAIVSETAGVKKPDARIFAQALAELQTAANETIFVGDHPQNDVLGAQSVGMQAVWMCGYHPWPEGEREPQWQIDQLTELLDIHF
jgi:HAD superfamily hydrolase (TIGR01549 family)